MGLDAIVDLVGLDVIPSYAGVLVRIRVHPREFELCIPWIRPPHVCNRINGKLLKDSKIDDPNVRQLRESLEWVDTGFMNRTDGGD